MRSLCWLECEFFHDYIVPGLEIFEIAGLNMEMLLVIEIPLRMMGDA